MPDHYWARLKPYNKQEGHLLRSITVESQVYQGGEMPAWYKVTPTRADNLRALHQDGSIGGQYDRRSDKAFDVVDDDGKAKIDGHENVIRLGQLGLMSASTPIPPSALPRVVDTTGGGSPAATALPGADTVDKDAPVSAGRASALTPERESHGSGDLTTVELARGGKRTSRRP